jgi:hypothetical protein
MVEKFGFVLALAVLYARSRIGTDELLPALPDFVLGLLFVAAYVKTRRRTLETDTTGRQRG